MSPGSLCSVMLLSIAISGDLQAAQSLGGLPVDELSTRQIVEATTDPAYLTEWVRAIPDHPDIPGPRDFLGYIVGAPGELTGVEQVHGYFDALDGASDRIRVFRMGRSHEGREMIVAAIADSDTLESIDAYRARLHSLSDPRQTPREEAQELIAGAKPIYWITGGLHSPELGPPEMLMELAYRLIVEQRPVFEDIRNHVITLITPILEVDGRARQVDWFHRHLKGHTDYYDRPPRSVPLWGHYTYHDNNRDGIAISQPLTQNYVNGVYEWKPTISLDLHESVPLLYLAGGTGPYNREISPVTISEWQALANYELARLSGLGLAGVWTWGFYTGWYPGYLLWTTNNHNSLGRFYETFGNGSSETMKRDLRDTKLANEEVTSRQWYRAWPPPEKLEWSMRNNINYMESGVITSLEMVAHNAQMFLENYYEKGVEALAQATREPPYAFVIPRQQRDRGGANQLVGVLRRQAIELEVSSAKGRYGEVNVDRGDLIVKLDQPYGPLAKNLLEKQEFPEGVPVPPYDDIAWTLGLMMGVQVVPVAEQRILEHESRPFGVEERFLEPGKLPWLGGVWIIPNRGQRELGPLRFALGDMPVLVAEHEFEAGRRSFPAGSLLLDLSVLDRDRLKEQLGRSSLEVASAMRMPEVATHELDVPRLAVFQSWTATQNAGWVRYSLDEAGIPYALIAKDRVRAGQLRGEFDVILVPHMRAATELADIVGGIDRKWSPLAYTQTEESPSLGRILSSEDITGGLGFQGMEALETFVIEGGTLISMGSGGLVAAGSGMIHDIEVKRPADLNTPGSILTAKVTDRSSPLTYGYDEVTHVFRGNGPIYGVKRHNRHLAVLQFGIKDIEASKDEAKKPKDGEDETPLVQSGGIVSGKGKIDGEPALLSVALGQGRVVLFGWNPMHRHVNHHDHAFLYNAILNWNDLPVPERRAPDG